MRFTFEIPDGEIPEEEIDETLRSMEAGCYDHSGYDVTIDTPTKHIKSILFFNETECIRLVRSPETTDDEFHLIGKGLTTAGYCLHIANDSEEFIANHCPDALKRYQNAREFYA